MMNIRELENNIDLYKKMALIYSRTLEKIHNAELEMLVEEALEGCFQAIEYLEAQQNSVQSIEN